ATSPQYYDMQYDGLCLSTHDAFSDFRNNFIYNSCEINSLQKAEEPIPCSRTENQCPQYNGLWPPTYDTYAEFGNNFIYNSADCMFYSLQNVEQPMFCSESENQRSKPECMSYSLQNLEQPMFCSGSENQCPQYNGLWPSAYDTYASSDKKIMDNSWECKFFPLQNLEEPMLICSGSQKRLLPENDVITSERKEGIFRSERKNSKFMKWKGIIIPQNLSSTSQSLHKRCIRLLNCINDHKISQFHDDDNGERISVNTTKHSYKDKLHIHHVSAE
ncbi:hypothetical protein KI387_042844, partial [Taxus chinensis]